MGNHVKILNCWIDAISFTETIDRIDRGIDEGKTIQHGCVYASKLAMMHRDPELFQAVTNSDIISGESQLLVWLSKFYDTQLPERVVGLELFEALIKLAYQRKHKVFLFGAREEIVKRVVEIYTTRYSGSIFAGYRNGYYTPREEKAIARTIAESGAQMLFVAMSTPKKELFLNRYAETLKPVNFKMGVGGSFDVIAGKVRRAPRWMQCMCLEWFYRFLQEPRDKWPMTLDSFRFLFLISKQAAQRYLWIIDS